MTEKCETKWSPIEDQIDNIIIPAMQGTAQQYAKYASELQCPPAFIAIMVRDIADTFEENAKIGDKDCDCVKPPSIRLLIKSLQVNYSVVPIRYFV